MLKWEKYSKLKARDKEEWNYRFKDKIEYKGAPSPFTHVLIIGMVFSTMMLTYFIVLKEYVSVALSFNSLFSTCLAITVVMLIVWVAQMIFDVVHLVYWNYKADKWLKERGVDNGFLS